MTVFRSSRRGAAIMSDRRAALEAFAARGLIEFPCTVEGQGRTAVQYKARAAGDRPGRWWLLDGTEVGPWLLGILDALSATGHESADELVPVMARLIDNADPVSPEAPPAG